MGWGWRGELGPKQRPASHPAAEDGKTKGRGVSRAGRDGGARRKHDMSSLSGSYLAKSSTN